MLLILFFILFSITSRRSSRGSLKICLRYVFFIIPNFSSNLFFGNSNHSEFSSQKSAEVISLRKIGDEFIKYFKIWTFNWVNYSLSISQQDYLLLFRKNETIYIRQTDLKMLEDKLSGWWCRVLWGCVFWQAGTCLLSFQSDIKK